VLADEVPIAFDGASIRRDDSFSPAIAFRVETPLLDEVTDGTREITLAVVEFRREFGDRVAARSTVERASSSIRRSTV